MTRQELVAKLAKRMGKKFTKKQGDIVVDAMLESIKDLLAEGHRIEIRDFGVFRTHKYPDMNRRNPATGESIFVKGRRCPKFKPSPTLNRLVNGS